MSEQRTNPKMLLRQYQRQSDVEGLYSLLDLEIHPQIKKEVLDTLAGIGTPEAYEGMGALLIQGRSNLSEYRPTPSTAEQDPRSRSRGDHGQGA